MRSKISKPFSYLYGNTFFFKLALLLRLPCTLTPPGSSNITSVISTFPVFLSAYEKIMMLYP